VSRAASFDDGFHTALTCGRSTGRHQDANWAKALVALLIRGSAPSYAEPALFARVFDVDLDATDVLVSIRDLLPPAPVV